jgi:hypothetical protein
MTHLRKFFFLLLLISNIQDVSAAKDHHLLSVIKMPRDNHMFVNMKITLRTGSRSFANRKIPNVIG